MSRRLTLAETLVLAAERGNVLPSPSPSPSPRQALPADLRRTLFRCAAGWHRRLELRADGTDLPPGGMRDWRC